MNDLLARADRALDNGRLDQAITLCRQVREQDTERFEANYWLFWALERKALMGDTPDAGELRQLRRWLLAHTEHPEQSETVARARLRVRSTPGSREAPLVRARCHILRGQAREALAATEPAALDRAMEQIQEAIGLWDGEPQFFQQTMVALLARRAWLLLPDQPRRAHAMLYHLLLRELDPALLQGEPDDMELHEPHLGHVLDRCPGYIDWVLTTETIDEPDAALIGMQGAVPTGDMNSLLMLVAGAGVNPLHRDVWAAGRPARMATVLRLGARIDVHDEQEGTTALHHLAALGDVNSMAFAVSRGADPEAVDGRGRPPLFWAAGLPGRAKAVHLLGELGVDPNAADMDGRTMLHDAAFAGDAELVEALLYFGANIAAGGEVGVTPLHMAARAGNAATVEALLRHGADPTARGESGTPLDEAADHPAVLGRLRRAAGLESGPEDPAAMLEQLARELGLGAGRGALESGEHQAYVDDDDLDADDLPGEYWEAHHREKVQQALEALDRSADTEERLERLYTIYRAAYDEAVG